MLFFSSIKRQLEKWPFEKLYSWENPSSLTTPVLQIGKLRPEETGENVEAF